MSAPNPEASIESFLGALGNAFPLVNALLSALHSGTSEADLLAGIKAAMTSAERRHLEVELGGTLAKRASEAERLSQVVDDLTSRLFASESAYEGAKAQLAEYETELANARTYIAQLEEKLATPEPAPVATTEPAPAEPEPKP